MMRLQLTGADYSYQADETYSYDGNGNRTNTGYSTGANNLLLSDGVYNYAYDSEGNRTKKTEIATGAWTEYSWDYRNRLVQLVHKDSSGAVVQTLDYTYDIFDRRIGRSDAPQVGPALATQYVYDGDHIALQFDSGQLSHRYLHGPVVDQILADEQVSSLSTPGDVLWPLTDNLGSVRDVAKYDAGTGVTSIVNHIAYDAFGNVESETNSAVDSLFGYTGREWDADADLQYNRARWYDPGTGRWMSQDPIGFAAEDANLYRYVGNQSTAATDSSGLIIETIWDAGNIALGVGSFGYNVWHGNWGDAALDVGGIAVDTAATLVPVVPGGAGTAIRAKRIADATQATANVAGAAAAKLGKNSGKVPVECATKTTVLDNAADGAARELRVHEKLSGHFTEASVQRERLLRTADGNKAIDPLTGEGRRIDHAVIQGGEARYLVETTSKTADKAAQIAKEARIRANGGTFVRDKVTRELIDVSNVPTRVTRRK